MRGFRSSLRLQWAIYEEQDLILSLSACRNCIVLRSTVSQRPEQSTPANVLQTDLRWQRRTISAWDSGSDGAIPTLKSSYTHDETRREGQMSDSMLAP